VPTQSALKLKFRDTGGENRLDVGQKLNFIGTGERLNWGKNGSPLGGKILRSERQRQPKENVFFHIATAGGCNSATHGRRLGSRGRKHSEERGFWRKSRIGYADDEEQTVGV